MSDARFFFYASLALVAALVLLLGVGSIAVFRSRPASQPDGPGNEPEPGGSQGRARAAGTRRRRRGGRGLLRRLFRNLRRWLADLRLRLRRERVLDDESDDLNETAQDGAADGSGEAADRLDVEDDGGFGDDYRDRRERDEYRTPEGHERWTSDPRDNVFDQLEGTTGDSMPHRMQRVRVVSDELRTGATLRRASHPLTDTPTPTTPLTPLEVPELRPRAMPPAADADPQAAARAARAARYELPHAVRPRTMRPSQADRRQGLASEAAEASEAGGLEVRAAGFPLSEQQLHTLDVPALEQRPRQFALAVPDRQVLGAARRNPRSRFIAAAHSARGRRRSNEDVVRARPELLAMADGVGGAAGGAQAAEIAVMAAVSAIVRTTDGAPAAADLVNAAHYAQTEVRGRAKSDPALADMATTLDLVCVVDDDRGRLTVHGLHIGDAAVWVLLGNGDVRLRTTPHSTGTGALLKMIGTTKLDFDTWEQEVERGDRVVMATDGLWADLDRDSLEPLLRSTRALSPSDQAQVLVDIATRAGGSDNVSVIVADVDVAAME